MTKKFKRIISAMLAFVMVLAIGSFSTYAAETHTITVNDTSDGHTYNVYQIFKGSYSEVNKLSDVVWGSGVTVDSTNTVSATDASEYIAANFKTDDGTYWGDELLEYLKSIGVTLNTTKSTLAYSTENKNYSADSFDSGYYIIKDESESLADDESYTSYIVQVLGSDETVEVKKSTPEVEKKVKDTNDSVADSTTDWQDSADYDIGDVVPFQITGTLPSNYSDYDTYKYVFHDKQSEGLTFNPSSLVVKVGDSVIDSSCYNVVTEGLTDGCTFEVAFADLKTITSEGTPVTLTSASKVVVEYNSTLNENAKLGSTGNPNEAKLEFSNNPNADGDGTTGTTPDDKVTVFTFELVINKVQPNPEYKNDEETPEVSKTISLAGAGFTLYKYDVESSNWVKVKVIEPSEASKFTFTGLDDGRYMIEESVTPTGFNTISDIYFKVEATHDVEATDPKLTELTVTVTDAEGNAKESKNVVINVDKDATEANLSTDVLNQSGSTLPETGGMGTKIFYALGGILFVGAAILLVVKRRMKNV